MKHTVVILIELEADTYQEAVKQVEAWVSVVPIVPMGTDTISMPTEFNYQFDGVQDVS